MYRQVNALASSLIIFSALGSTKITFFNNEIKPSFAQKITTNSDRNFLIQKIQGNFAILHNETSQYLWKKKKNRKNSRNFIKKNQN